ncbi:MAG: flavodoxin domain-containing protein [Dehalococcoidia bacterium]|nr:flavodoxin domain-containing protein [Dehalococcoidia bacterium]
MKVLVTYLSRTGNTKKVAQAIFEQIKVSKEINELEKVDSLESYDLAFVGFPIEGYGPAKPAAEFIRQHAAGRRIALFITHASPEDSPDLQGWLDNCKAAAAEAKLVSVFDCQGELSEQMADFMTKSNDEKLIAWANDRPTTIGQPDATRLERARRWAKEVLAKSI